MYCRYCRAVRCTAKSEDCHNISLWYPLSVTYGGFLAVCHYSDCNDKICPPAVWLVKKRSDTIPRYRRLPAWYAVLLPLILPY